MISLGTQTDLNFELILNFISNDLPRLVSYDLVPLLLKIMTDPCKDAGGDLSKSLRRKVEELIREIVERSLPKSQTIELKKEERKPGYAPKRRKTNTTTAAATEEKSSSVTLIHQPQCEVCGEAFEKYPDVVKHLLTHKETVCRAINCNLCNFFTFEPRALAVHMKDKHLLGKGAPITLRCKICQEAFFSESALSKHKKSYHRGSDIPKCPKCNVLFEFSSQLVTHLRFSATCGGETKQADPEASRYFKLPPVRAPIAPSHQRRFPAPKPDGVPTSGTNVSLSVPGSSTTANMVGNALLSALTVEPGTGQTAIEATAAVSQSISTTLSPPNISENLIMDPTTGKPIPVAQFVEKRQAEIAGGAEILNSAIHTNKGYKCSVCNRSFTSLSMLVHHNEKAHLRKKTLSCTQCHLLFATFSELDSHFHRIHRKRIPPGSEAPANRAPQPVLSTENRTDHKTNSKTGGRADIRTDGDVADRSKTTSTNCSEDMKTRIASKDYQGNQSIQPTSQDNCDEVNETERATAIESEIDISVPSNKRKAKSLNQNPIKSVLKEKDNEPGQVKSSEGIQIKSKRGRTIAKVNYNEIYK